MNKNIKNAIFITSILIPTVFFGQLRISENIQASKIATEESYPLYFIEYWATWCVPCLHMTKQLEAYQKQYSKEVYFVSLTQENPNIVKQFLEEKHSTNLAVAIDYEGEAFKHMYKYNNALPFATLLNANGDILWKGNPTDFNFTTLRRFLSQNKEKIAVSKMLRHKKIEKVYYDINATIPNSDFEIVEIKDDDFQELQITNTNSWVQLQGSLQDILAYSLKTYKGQINLSPNLNKQYKVTVNTDSNVYNNLYNKILKKLRLKDTNKVLQEKALVLDMKDAKLWDTQQIDWGEGASEFLIDTKQIQANNTTFQTIKYMLASVLEMPVVTKRKYNNNDKHDWRIHYKYLNFLQEDLLDIYGIKAEIKASDYTVYSINR